MPRKIEMRAVAPDDEPFLLALFRAVRAPRFDFHPGGHPQMASSIALQFKAREQAIASKFPGSEDSLIEADGAPAGRFRVACDETGFDIADLAVLPERQRSGIATGVVNDLIAKAESARLPIRAVIPQSDVASFQFFRRLGFGVREQDTSYIRLERPAASSLR